ncbi:MAG TPA: hypothetical protein VJQ82_10665 [Terriglobales bacterium]|nr:hypothetical protein [Terriglobales bacterium]
MRDGKPIESRVLMAVVFDPKTGHIAHYHRVHIFDPQRKITQTEVEERARSLAARHGWDVTKLETMSIDPARFRRGVRLKVNAKSRSLVELPPVELKMKNPLRKRSSMMP